MNTRKKHLISLLMLLCASAASAQNWPETGPQMRPCTRWWWLGSAVDTAGLRDELDYLEKSGVGGVEITPVYGVRDNGNRDIAFLSPQWMACLDYTCAQAGRKGMQVDMNNGTGWPFGGPQIGTEDAAAKAVFQEYSLQGGRKQRLRIVMEDSLQQGVARLSRVMAFSGKERLDLTGLCRDGELRWKAPKTADGKPWRILALFVGRSFQEVNRAAPGGEGLVMDHFSAKALDRYLSRFDEAFRQSGSALPRSFFNDSYEVYDADWTPDFLNEFRKRRGYALEYYFPEFLQGDSAVRSECTRRVVSDYRETLSDLLKENFTARWTEWAHRHGVQTRSQAHGSPGNLIDLYAIVDIPECEGFGLSDFGIRGLRKDSLTRRNDCDLSMLKYASSAAHLSGKRLTSSETFTWLTEHFRTSFSQCKPDLDLMFVAGVNHIIFHGTAYSPKWVEWPGWRFYASVDMSRQNPQFVRDMPAMSEYIRRVQSFMQRGEPDNDFLLYLPIYDIWDAQPGRYIPFEIDHMQERTPEFIRTVNAILEGGYDVDYISDGFILSTTFTDGWLRTAGGTRYRALVVPSVRIMPEQVLAHLISLMEEGATVIFTGQYPSDVPGLHALDARRKQFSATLDALPAADFRKADSCVLGKGRVITGKDFASTLALSGAAGEAMKTRFGLQFNRRRDSLGSFYFISCLQPEDVSAWIPLSRKASRAAIYDPMSGETGEAALRQTAGRSEVLLQLRSGESLILRLYEQPSAETMKPWKYLEEKTDGIQTPVTPWTLEFTESIPTVKGTFTLDTLLSWTEIQGPESLRSTMATGLYRATFRIRDVHAAEDWLLDLGDVRESARVRINGQPAGTVWAVPYVLKVGKLLRDGENTVEIEVCNLPANRIAADDRRGKEWRIFKNINVVNIHYEPSDYSRWEPVPSGLCSPVRLIPMENAEFQRSPSRIRFH